MKADYLAAGDIYGFVASTYTDVLGSWAYLVILGIFAIMLYLKTQGFEMPFTVAFIGCAALGFILPVNVGAYFSMLLAIASAVILIRVFKS